MPAEFTRLAATPEDTSPLRQLKSNLRAMWMAGDFGVIARTVEADAQRFATRLGFPPGSRVLDVATGTGNLALPIARGGATVFGVDIAPNLLQQARARATTEGLQIQFDEGDAEDLPYADASFDAVVTIFGAMFAPRPEQVVKEFARVLRPGGLLAMGNWTPAGFSGRMFAVGARHAPPPPGIPAPVLWGDPATVRQRLEGRFHDIQTEVVPILFDLPLSPADTVEHFRRYFGPTQVAFQRLDAPAQQSFAHDLTQLWSGANTAVDPTRQTLVQNEYLQVLATRND